MLINQALLRKFNKCLLIRKYISKIVYITLLISKNKDKKSNIRVCKLISLTNSLEIIKSKLKLIKKSNLNANKITMIFS